MNYIFPIDGDVLFTHADGEPYLDGLKIKVLISASKGKNITVNGIRAKEKNGVYEAQIYIDAYRNSIEVIDTDTKEIKTIVVYWFRNGYKTYRLGVDDVIRCFQNIYNHQNEYTSIFDDPFLNLFRDVHDKYGTYIHMHIYYETEDAKFNLSMFPDKYKKEFQKNGDWLKFTFHARADFPQSPYKFANYEQVMKDGKMVEREIIRFAGKEVLSNVTSQHWANSNLWATRAFRNLGFKCIDGYFLFDENGDPYVSYYLDKEQTAHAKTRDFWVDNNEDIIFVKDDIIINEVEPDKIDDYMEKISTECGNCFHYLLIHEQQFYEDFWKNNPDKYNMYQPDYKERLFKTVDWCHKNGYKPAAISSIAFEERR